jgi:hypothetical protein
VKGAAILTVAYSAVYGAVWAVFAGLFGWSDSMGALIGTTAPLVGIIFHVAMGLYYRIGCAEDFRRRLVHGNG